MTYDIRYRRRDVQASDRDSRASLIANQVFNQGVVRRTFHRHTFISISNLSSSATISLGRKTLFCLIIMNPVIITNSIDSIITAKVCSTDRKMVDFNIDTEIKHKMKLRAVHENQIMNCCIDRRDQADQSWSHGAVMTSTWLLEHKKM